MRPLAWLSQRDRDFVALRRAGRTAIVMPALFALGDKVLGNPELATFAAFGSFAMLLLVDFGGPMAQRLQAQAALAVTGGVFVCLGTLASGTTWLAVAAMAAVGFGVIFTGVVSSVLAGATTSLLLAFILPVSLAAPASAVPDRLAGWAIASVASLAAVALLWPAPARDPLRGPATTACRALAARLRSEVAAVLSGGDSRKEAERHQTAEQADHAVSALRRAFLARPHRPTGLSTAARTIVRLVDEVGWLHTIAMTTSQHDPGAPIRPEVCAVKTAAAQVLDRGADLLSVTGGNSDDLHASQAELTSALRGMEDNATVQLPVHHAAAGAGVATAEQPAAEFLTSLDPAFRAQELSFAVSLIARDVDLTAAAEQRGWRDRLLGRQPSGLPGTLASAQERAAAHVEPHSVWLHNSVRGAAGLGLAVLVAKLTGVQHSFWVVLGTLSVLRSSALSTGQDVIRALLGTVAGLVIGVAVLAVIGANTTLLWFLLPLAIFLAGVAPAAISFAGGQAAFTLVLVILFNIIHPTGWQVGLLRLEDIALGCAVSLAVGILFWPQGAGRALSRALAEAYTDSAGYLTSAVSFGMLRCEAGGAGHAATAPAANAARAAVDASAMNAARAAAAARRLDDAYRTYLAERGAKPIPLAEVTRLVTGVAGLRLAADAVLDLWQCDGTPPEGDRSAARREILDTAERTGSWYRDLAESLVSGREPREPLPHDFDADARLVQAVRNDLRAEDGNASATAVRMIWTGDHLDAARRLQAVLVGPARTVARQRTRNPIRARA